MKKPPKEITISITKDLKYYINRKQVPFSGIETELEKLKEGNDEVYAIVRADNSITVQLLVDVLQSGNKTEVKMFLATTRKDAKNIGF